MNTGKHFKQRKHENMINFETLVSKIFLLDSVTAWHVRDVKVPF